MKIEQFIRESTELKSGKNRTININADLHLFLKRTANHYNIAISDLVHNILISWKKEYQKKIKEDMRNQFDD